MATKPRSTSATTPAAPAPKAVKSKPGRPRTKRPDPAAAAMSQLADALAGMQRPTAIMGEPMVGIRNISNYTIGLRSPFQDEPDLQLSAPRYLSDAPLEELYDPNMTAQISHKWWMTLRRGKQVARAMLMRDDSVLSAGVTQAPADGEQDIAPSFAVNVILKPHEWIEAKDEVTLKTAIAALTAEESLRRLLTAVNQRIEHERRQLAIKDDNADGDLEEQALKNLPWRYKIVEELVTARLERDFYGRTL